MSGGLAGGDGELGDGGRLGVGDGAREDDAEEGVDGVGDDTVGLVKPEPGGRSKSYS